jgi:proline iminopeptidase
MPPDQWPEPVNRAFKHMNPAIYIPMQGPSELGASGKLVNWDRSRGPGQITVPTLVIGAHDTMDPKHIEWMAGQMPKGPIYTAPMEATWRCTTISRRALRCDRVPGPGRR